MNLQAMQSRNDHHYHVMLRSVSGTAAILRMWDHNVGIYSEPTVLTPSKTSPKRVLEGLEACAMGRKIPEVDPPDNSVGSLCSIHCILYTIYYILYTTM